MKTSCRKQHTFEKIFIKIGPLENNVIVNNVIIQSSSTSPETLHVVESRQYRENGLINITDASYEFFLALEQHRVDNINATQLMVKQKNLVDDAINEIVNDEELKTRFMQLFASGRANNKVILVIIYANKSIKNGYL